MPLPPFMRPNSLLRVGDLVKHDEERLGRRRAEGTDLADPAREIPMTTVDQSVLRV